MPANLNENVRKYSCDNAVYTHMKIICIFVKYSLLAAIKKGVNKSAATETEFTTEDEHIIKRL